MKPLLFLASLLLASTNVLAQSEPADDSDDLLLLIPAIVAKQEPPLPPPSPEWAAINSVCCSTSSATFTLNQGSVRATSTAPSCSVAASASPFNISTPGNKRFTSSLRSRGCGNITIPAFNFPFEEAKRYVFELAFDSGSVVINVFSGDIDAAKTKESAVLDTRNMKQESTVTIEQNATGFSSVKVPEQ